jgi:hypothetical protein
MVVGFMFGFFGMGIQVFAIENPLGVPNNKFGVHILFASELSEAARLVNSNGGDWGYITIPIQATDKNLIKWQKFMDDSRSLHLIPIIRLATENYYFNTKVWRKPDETDILDFANFLDSLDWPTQNRYVVIFNEVNRSDEWGQEFSPAEYAKILQYAVMVFKSKQSDFFIISAGLDNASANIPKESMDEYKFMLGMNDAVPGIFNQIDGLGSHSYPNPGFSQPASVLTPKSISSFKYEKDLVGNLSGKSLPVFITETGWSLNMVSESKVASYYEEAFASVWNDEAIVAVTPFLLRAGAGPFVQFSLINSLGGPTLGYKAIDKIQKVKGAPKLSENNITDNIDKPQKNLLPTKNFLDNLTIEKDSFVQLKTVKTILKWFIQP